MKLFKKKAQIVGATNTQNQGAIMNKNKKKFKFSLFNCLVGIALVVYTLTIFYALYFITVSSFKSEKEFDSNYFGIPHQFSLDSLKMIFNTPVQATRGGVKYLFAVFPDVFIYTILYVFGSAFLASLIPCLTAYFASKFNYKFSKVIYATVVIVMIIPIVGNFPSTLEVLNTLKMYDTIWGAWIMKGNFVNMYFLVYYAMFKSIPEDYREAAFIDGASEFRVMFNIMLPLIKTTFMTVMLIFFVQLWNDYQTPLLYLPSHPTLAVVVYNFSNSISTNLSHVAYKMAACAIMIIPTIILFICFKNKLMGNLTLGGIKG